MCGIEIQKLWLRVVEVSFERKFTVLVFPPYFIIIANRAVTCIFPMFIALSYWWWWCFDVRLSQLLDYVEGK